MLEVGFQFKSVLEYSQQISYTSNYVYLQTYEIISSQLQHITIWVQNVHIVMS